MALPIGDTSRERESEPGLVKGSRYYFRVYLWLLKYLLPYKWQMALFIVCGLLISLSQMAVVRVIQFVIDKVVMAKDAARLELVIGMLVAILVVMFSAMAANNLLSRLVREKAARDLQFDCMKQLRKLSFSYFERTGVGETLSLLNSDVSAVQGIYQRHFPSLVNNALLLGVAIAFIVQLSPRLLVVTLPCSLLFYVIGPYLTKKASYWGIIAKDRRTEWNRKIYESVTGLAELRAFQRQEWDSDRFEERQTSYNESQRKQFVFRSLRSLARQGTSLLGTIVMFAYAAYLNRHGVLTVGEFVSFTMYYRNLNQQSAQLVSILIDQSLLLQQGEKLRDFMRLQPEVKEATEPKRIARIEGHLQFRDVRFGYGDRDILRNFSLDVRAGERVAFVGASGNGKSTLLKLIGRFYDPSGGELRLDGVPLHELSLSQLRDAIGYVFQETYLFGTTVRENIRFGFPDATDEQVEEAARAANAHEFIMLLPEGYDTSVGERGVKLSGGQRQRLSIARMFIKNPRIVLLDEATSALDNGSEGEVLKALERLMHGRTTVAVAHRLSTIRDYDRIIVLKDGKVSEQGTYRELMASRGWLYELEGKSASRSAALG